jgi:hypothetical protein
LSGKGHKVCEARLVAVSAPGKAYPHFIVRALLPTVPRNVEGLTIHFNKLNLECRKWKDFICFTWVGMNRGKNGLSPTSPLAAFLLSLVETSNVIHVSPVLSFPGDIAASAAGISTLAFRTWDQ